MAEIKAHEFERFIAGPLGFRILLIYGPDRGLVSERAEAIAAKTGIDPGDAFATIKLDANDIAGDPGRLSDEAESLGLFGGERLIWIRDAGNERGLTTVLQDLIARPPQSSYVVIEAGELKKGTALRRSVETAKTAIAIPCYADDAKALQALIDEELGAAGLRLTLDARRRLVEQLGGDRRASRNELRKLALYCMGMQEVTEDDVIALTGDVGALSVDVAVDAVLAGDAAGLDLALQRISASKTSIYTVLAALLRQFQSLLAMRTDMEQNRTNVARAMQGHGRGIHFRRRPLVETLLGRLDAAAITAILDHLHKTVLETRRMPALEMALARHGLLAVAIRMSRLRSRA